MPLMIGSGDVSCKLHFSRPDVFHNSTFVNNLRVDVCTNKTFHAEKNGDFRVKEDIRGLRRRLIYTSFLTNLAFSFLCYYPFLFPIH